MAQTVCVILEAEDRERLATFIGDRNRPQKHVKRARIVRDGVAPFRINNYTAASWLLPLDEPARLTWIDGELLIQEREIVVPTTWLDTFLNESRIAEVEFLKLDAQGDDFAVIQSAGDRLGDIGRIKLEVR